MKWSFLDSHSFTLRAIIHQLLGNLAFAKKKLLNKLAVENPQKALCKEKDNKARVWGMNDEILGKNTYSLLLETTHGVSQQKWREHICFL